METIGNRIERARKERKISQTALADAMGISQQQVSYMEGRADSDMTVGFIMAACSALKVSPQYVVFGEVASQAGIDPAIEPVVNKLSRTTAALPKTMQALLLGSVDAIIDTFGGIRGGDYANFV